MSKNVIWGVVLGAVGMFALVFISGFMVTSGHAESVAEERAHDAVVAQWAKICVAHFKRETNTGPMIKELQGQSVWTRGEYVQEKGWAKVQGLGTPGEDVLKTCGNNIAEL